MSAPLPNEEKWAAWLLARNRRATRTLLSIVVVLYPMFGILDYLIAPKDWLEVLYVTRATVLLVTLAMFRVVRSGTFERAPNLLSSCYLIMPSCGISLMTVRMGGLESPYYAGLSLAIVAAGLLFVWPRRVVIWTHLAIVASFVIPNLAFGAKLTEPAAISNLFFLVSTAVVAGTGQMFAYRTHQEQVTNQLVIEYTRANLERTHARLQELDRFKSEFFANITHELKTPLTMILAPLELMIQGELGKLSDSQNATLKSMLRSGVKLLKLIGDLLDLSRIDESRLRLQIEEHDLVKYLSDLTVQVEPLTHRKAISLSFSSSVPECKVFCDLERLERVFVNLLSNAAKFTPSQGRVSVELTELEERVRVSVTDTGVGFPPDMANRVFDRFFQVDMAGTRKYGGTGIGLALARDLVELHGGAIWAESMEAGGARFTVELRRGREHFAPDRVDRRTRSEDRAVQSRVADHSVGEWQVESEGRFRFIDIDEATEQRIIDRDPWEHERELSVLVVEDTPDVIRMIHLALRGHFRVLAASDGFKGFDIAVKHLPSLIITDRMMPGMDGVELMEKLRNEPRTRHIPIVMLTARGDASDRASGMDAGASAYLTKPFSTKELLSTVRGLVKIQAASADILLTQNMNSLETIAGGLAHEVNNPLNYLKSSLWLIRSDANLLLEVAKSLRTDQVVEAQINEASERLARMYEVAESGVRRIGSTVALMQRYSREGYSRVRQPFDSFESARDVTAMLQSALTKPVIETKFEGDGTAHCVPEELNQVLTNLIQNALDALPRDGEGRVLVSGRVTKENVELSIKDNGIGIKVEDRARIFTPFYTTKEVGKGMGLGLTIVHRVVQSHGGSVQVTSEVGAGTEFTIRLPKHSSAAIEWPAASASGAGSHPQSPT